jgi:hypothetical protein
MAEKLGTYFLANVGPYALKADVYVNDEFNTSTYPGTLTPVRGVKVGDKVTIMKRAGLFRLGKEIFAEFELNEASVDYDDN